MWYRNAASARGSVIVYILAALFMMGALVVALTSGPKKSAITAQLDELVARTASDIGLAEAIVGDCVLQYPASVDVDGNGTIDATDNPNPPFPIYGDATSGGTTGDDLDDVICPGKPGMPVLFDGNAGRSLQISADAHYTLTYINNTTEGAYVRITRAASDPLWLEAIQRLDDKYSECKAADVPSGGACANGCFYYWFSRLSTSAIAISGGDEDPCP